MNYAFGMVVYLKEIEPHEMIGILKKMCYLILHSFYVSPFKLIIFITCQLIRVGIGKLHLDLVA